MFEKHVISWCIENYVPLRQFAAHELHVLFYEHLHTNPGVEVERLFEFIGQSYDDAVLRFTSKPSALARPDSAIVMGGDVTGDWKNFIDDKQTAQALEILRRFDLHRLYSEDPMPLPSRGANPLAGAAHYSSG